MRTKPLRQLMVVLHVLTSVGWLTLALAQLLLMAHAISSPSMETQRAALTMTEHIDEHLLGHAAVWATYSGLMLSALTPWGFFRFRWVTIKFALVIGCLYIGVFLLSEWLEAGVAASAAGGVGPVGRAVGLAPALVAALAFATWLSVVKPWGRTRWALRGQRDPEVPAAVWAAALIVPFADYLAGLEGGLCLLAVLGYALYRRRRLRPMLPNPAPGPP